MDTETAVGKNSVNPEQLQILWVPPHHVDELWPIAFPLLRKARAFFDNYATEKYCVESLKKEKMQLFMINDNERFHLAFLTEIREYDCVKSLNVVCVGGDHFKVAMNKFFDHFLLWARHQGVGEILFRGRPGFQKLFKRYGFVHAYTAIKLDLTGTRVH